MIEKIILTNSDLWAFNNSPAFNKQRATDRVKEKLKFRKWIMQITESIDYKAFNEVYQESIKKQLEIWKENIKKIYGNNYLEKLDEEKINSMFSSYLQTNWVSMEKELKFADNTDIEIEKYILKEREMAIDLNDFEITFLMKFFNFVE